MISTHWEFHTTSVASCITIMKVLLKVVHLLFRLMKRVFHLEVLLSLAPWILNKPTYSTKFNVVSWFSGTAYILTNDYYSFSGFRSWSASRLPPPANVNPFVLPVGRCNRHLSGKTGTFSPPDFYYQSNTECIWIVEVPTGYSIRITFYNVEIE